MLIYLDLCCFNRPWDDQKSARVRIETEAKLLLQERVRSGQTSLIWSYILTYEDQFNPHRERRESVANWQALASTDVAAATDVIATADVLVMQGAGAFDALHVACAVKAGAAMFVTTDDRLRRLLQRNAIIPTFLPQEALAKLEHWYEN